jgi:11-cis-retinol dehydrogenase
LVNNAGSLGVNGPDDWLIIDDYQKVMDINAMGVIRVSQKFKPLVKKAKGRMVTVASVLGRVALKSAGPYCMSKYACEAYMDVLRQEMRDFGVTVHILEPGTFCQTGIHEINAMDKLQEMVWNRTSDSTKSEYGPTFFEECQFPIFLLSFSHH